MAALEQAIQDIHRPQSAGCRPMSFSNPDIAHWMPVLSLVTRATSKRHTAQNRNS